MSTVDAADLRRFIELSHDGQRDLNSKIAYRYLRLLERCFDYLDRTPNPARQAIAATDRAHLAEDAPMMALGPDDLGRFLAALPAGRTDDTEGHAGWKRRRDRAMQVVMALAGPARGRSDRAAAGRSGPPARHRRRHRAEHHARGESTAPATNTR